jgi:trimethylamine--corrinoid protein Co-methyltransferase
MSKPLSCQTVDGIGLLAEFYDTSPEKMRESAGGGLAYGITFINPLSPLGMSSHESDKLIKCCEAGISVALSPMSMAGMTAPCTIEGLLIQQNAEILGAMVLSQLAVPGAPVLYGCLGSTTNMRNMMTPVGAAESRIIEYSAAQMARYYKVPSRAIVGMTDSNELDYQAGAESILNYVQAARGGVNVMTGLGCYANWMIASYEKLLLDADSVAYVKRLLRPMDFAEERAALDVIQSVGPRGNYSTGDHTVEHFRDEFFAANVFCRQPYDNYAESGKEACRQTANKKIRDMLDSFTPKPLEKSLDKRLCAYVQKFGLGEYI